MNGITTDNHQINAGHAYLPFASICLACVCGQLLIPGPDSHSNNEGQTAWCVSAPLPDHISYETSATVNRASGSLFGVLSEDVQYGAGRLYFP